MKATQKNQAPRDVGELRLRLDPVDRHLLTLLDAEPDASFADLADDLSLSARSVARRLRRLVDGGAVQVRGRTLPGFQGRLVRMIRIEAEPEAARRLAEALAREVHTSWVRLSRDGTGLLCGAVAAPDEQGARSGVEQIVAASMRSPGVRDVQTIELLRVWGSRPASDRPSRALDDVDRALLRALAADGRMSNGALAEQVGIDASTVSRRRRRLLDEGVLYLEADIHPEALTGSGDVMLWITVTPGHIAEVAEALRAQRVVRFVAATSGRTSLVANVVTPDGAATLDFVDTHLAHPGVVGVEIVTMGRVLKGSSSYGG